jgi:signal transduction histidine kinase/PAS domain-containing protein
MNKKAIDNFDSHYDFSLSVSYISDSILVFSKVKNFLFEHINCSEILLFLDDRDKSCLTAPFPYNPNRNLKDINIPYKDTLVKNILIDRKTFTRTSLDETLFPEFESELFVPLISPEDTLGFIYLARKQQKVFTAEEIKLAEFASHFMTTPIERATWEDRLVRTQQSTQNWQEKYLSLIDAMPFPAAVIDMEQNKINEVNDAFVNVSGLSFQELYSTAVTQILEIEGANDLTKINSDQAYKIRFLKTEVNSELYEGSFSPTDAQQGTTKLLSIIPATIVSQPDNNWNQLLFDFHKSVEPEKELSSLFQSAIPIFSKIFNSGYFTLHSLTRDKRLILESAFLFKGQYIARPNDHILAAINEGPFSKIIETGSAQYVSDVYSDPNFKEWIPIAKKVGYRSLVSLPIDLREYGTNILSIFVSGANVWDDLTRKWLYNFRQISEELISKHYLSIDLKKRSEQIEILGKLTKEINSKLDFQSVIKTAAIEMKKVLPFDYFSIILFDDQGKDDQIYDLATKPTMDILGDEWQWQALENSELGWITPLKAGFETKESDSLKPQRMPFSLPSHTSVLLLSGENYLGNCALGRIEQRAFLQPELQFLRQVAGQIATAIKNSRLYGETKNRLNEISTLSKVSRSISETLDVDSILSISAKAAEESVLAPQSKIVEITDQTTSKDLFFWMPAETTKAMGDAEIQKIILAIESQKQPLIIESPLRFIEAFSLGTDFVSKLSDFKPVIISPILRESKLFACLFVVTNGEPNIIEHDLKIVTTLSSQAQNAISKADLFQKSIKNAEELESFVYSVSHELKTPILTVQSFASLLKEEYDKIMPPNASNYLNRISVNLSQMQTLIMDLLDLSRIGRNGIEYVDCESNDLIHNALDSLSGLLNEYPTEINLSEDLPQIFAHPNLITQVFTNLISNAIKYSKKKTKPLIKIGCKETRTVFEFFVHDNGIGIPDDLLDRIFDLFHTKNDKDEDMSTGVGLTIVKKIIELHKGTIWVESKLGKGSNFKFAIPKKQTI